MAEPSQSSWQWVRIRRATRLFNRSGPVQRFMSLVSIGQGTTEKALRGIQLRGLALLTLVLLTLVLFGACISIPKGLEPSTSAAAQSDADLAPAPRTLVIALDAVPFNAAVAAFGASASTFDRYLKPIPVVSSFPSTTTLAFTGMFEGVGLATPPGYEAKFYDLEEGRVRGGGAVSYGKIEFSWREFFDWKTEGALRKAVGYSRPLAFSRAEFRRGVQAFLDSSHPAFYMYVGATDGVAHLAGPEAFVEVLADLAAVLDEARIHEPDFVTVMLSDHGVGGGEPLENVRKAVVGAARAAGFSVGRRVRSENDLVLVPYGLLSSFVAFTSNDQAQRAARELGAVKGVQVCAARGPSADGRGEHFLLASNGGEATLELAARAKAADSWRYSRKSGDPLELGDLFDSLGDSEGWVSDRQLLRETAAHRFPDPAHRVARAFDLVEHQASVVCSVAPGYMYGAALTEFAGRLGVGRLRWTHGALERDDSLGFVTTDLRSVDLLKDGEMILRFDELVQRLGLTAESKRPRRLANQP